MARPIHGAGFFGTSVYIRTIISNRLSLSEIKYYFHNRQTQQCGNQPVNALSRNRFIGLDVGERVPGNQQVRGPERSEWRLFVVRAERTFLVFTEDIFIIYYIRLFIGLFIRNVFMRYISCTRLRVYRSCDTSFVRRRKNGIR